MKKILSIVLSAMMLFPIVACKGNDKNSQEQQSSQETILPKGVVLVNDFENNDEFNLLRLFGVLGKVTKNTDENWTEKVAIDNALSRLDERERKIITLRYYEGKTQTEISEQVGISQAQVSRLEKNALKTVKNLIHA